MVGLATKPVRTLGRLNRKAPSWRPRLIRAVPAAAFLSAALFALFQLRWMGSILLQPEAAVTFVSLGIPKNNVNETFPLRILKGSHPSSYDGLKRNRTLVVVWGSVRSTERAWRTLYSRVLDVHSADLALIIQQDPSTDVKSTSLYSRAKYVWEYHAFDNWGDAVDMVGKSRDEGKTWRDFARQTQIALGGVDVARKGSGAILFLIRWFAMNCLEGLLPYYDTFVFTRSDHWYFCPDPVNMITNGSVWIPVGEDWGGITDRHLVCGRDDVMTLLNVLPPIVERPAEHMEALRHPEKIVRKGWSGGIRNSETLLKLRWVKEGIFHKIRRYPRNMAITTTLQQNNVGWAKPAPPNGTAAGLYFKYPGEYMEMKDNGCTTVPKDEIPEEQFYVKGQPNWMSEEEANRPYHCGKCRKHKLGCLEDCDGVNAKLWS